MSFLPPIFQTLQAVPALVALLGPTPFRVFPHGASPQDQLRPYVTWQLITGTPENTLSELPSIDRQTVQVDCWSPNGADVESLALLIRSALEPKAHMTGVIADYRETDTKLYRISLQFDWWQSRPGP